MICILGCVVAVDIEVPLKISQATLCRCRPAHPGQAVMVVVREMTREGQQLFKKTFIPGNGFGRAGVDSEPERGGPPSVGKPGDLQLGFAIGAGVLEHLICGRRADRPTFRDSHELLAKLSKALLSRKIIWFRVPITLIRVRLFTSKFNRIFLVSTHLSKPQKHYSG